MNTSTADTPEPEVSESTVRAHIAAQGRAQDVSDMAEAMTHAAMAVELSQHVGSPGLLAEALLSRATVHEGANNYDQALQDLEASRVCFEDAGLLPSRRFYNVLADVYNTLRRWDDAVDACRDSVQAARRQADTSGEALSLIVLAAFLSDAVESEEEEAERADPGVAGAPDRALAQRALASARLDEARQACDAALALIDAGAHHLRPPHNSTLGGVLLLQGQHAAAKAVLQAQPKIAGQCGEAASLTWAYRLLGRLHLLDGEYEQALRDAKAGLANAERLDQRRDLVKLHALLCTIHEARRDPEAALRSLRNSIRVERQIASAATSVRSDVLGVQLRTVAARREATSQREQAEALQRSNTLLQRQAETLTREAMEDPLTGLANRRSVDMYLAEQHLLSANGGESVGLALLDVDHFKRVNDDFSHAVGDQVLKALGELMRRHMRVKDLAGRYGGEEFVICWSGARLSDASRLCERLREAVQKHDWAAIAPGLQVTVSLGLVDLGAHDSAATALAAADALLYAAKAGGRNQVRMAVE